MLYSDVETTKKVGCYCSSNDQSVGVGRTLRPCRIGTPLAGQFEIRGKNKNTVVLSNILVITHHSCDFSSLVSICDYQRQHK